MGNPFSIFKKPKPPKPPPVPDYAAIAEAARLQALDEARGEMVERKRRSGRERTILTGLGDQEQSTLLGE